MRSAAQRCTGEDTRMRLHHIFAPHRTYDRMHAHKALANPPVEAPVPATLPVPSFFPGRQWQQILERDAAADGQFFYAVKSTKIYCKPSCASRRPARKQVSFFPTTAAAEAAGYRACMRCEPDRAP